MQEYSEFLKSKKMVFKSKGMIISKKEIHPKLFQFQCDLVRWSLRKGRAAIFADTGLGKTLMQLEYARFIPGKVLIVAPLSVAKQTISEAKKINIDVEFVRAADEIEKKISITNYEMINKFDPDVFEGVVLDESSILKSIDGKTKSKLIDMFRNTRYKLCCTATPAPNDIQEIANHAEFLGIMKRIEMLSSFFIHDAEGWRLKKHATEPFFKWLASWGMSVKMPSDLGYSDEGYILPDLNIEPVFVETEAVPIDTLFFMKLKGIKDRHNVRKITLDEKIEKTFEILNSSTEQFIVWTGLNEEANRLKRMVPDSVNVQGSDSIESKTRALEDFQEKKVRVLITKSKIAGFGMNFQNAHKMIFLGLSDSFEAYYQCVRRCYRFGQQKPVSVYIVLSEIEREIYENVMRKEREANIMSENLIKNVQKYEENISLDDIVETEREADYVVASAKGAGWEMMLGDSVERIKEIADETIDLSVFSPPFMSLYVYSPTERDLGNSKDEKEFFDHFRFIIKDLYRITKKGRICAVHVSQIPAMLVNDGYIGLKDFRGKTIEAFISENWIFHGEVCIDKNPQIQAIRTHSKGLTFAQKNKDSSWSRPGLADYILLFRKFGENAEPVLTDISNEEWITWAHPVWYGIRETEVLNGTEAKGNDDERHICPLQLGTIERVIRLWSNKGDTVFSPFAGIGSEGYQALKFGRKFIGIELKKSYFEIAVKNLDKALTKQNNMFVTLENLDKKIV
jgi:superfamily II DNA or RNA helicase